MLERLRQLHQLDPNNLTLIGDLIHESQRHGESPSTIELLRTRQWKLSSLTERLDIEVATRLQPSSVGCAPWCAGAWANFSTTYDMANALTKNLLAPHVSWLRHWARGRAYDNAQFRIANRETAAHTSIFRLTRKLYWRAELSALRLLREREMFESEADFIWRRHTGIIWWLIERFARAEYLPIKQIWAALVVHTETPFPVLVNLRTDAVRFVGADKMAITPDVVKYKHPITTAHIPSWVANNVDIHLERPRLLSALDSAFHQAQECERTQLYRMDKLSKRWDDRSHLLRTMEDSLQAVSNVCVDLGIRHPLAPPTQSPLGRLTLSP